MKRILLILFLSWTFAGLFGQYTSWPGQYSKVFFYDSCGYKYPLILLGATSGYTTIKTDATAGGTIVIPASATTDTLSTKAYARSVGGEGGAGMIYPEEGLGYSTGSQWGSSVTNNSTNWNTAYTDRLKWDGGATGLIAATGRTSLGGTTIGQAMFTLPNPGVITFARFNANNTVTAQSAADFKTSLSLENVTNESKTTMFSDPTFTTKITTPAITLGSTLLTPIGTQYNYLSGTTGTTGTGNLVLSASPTITGHPTIEGVTSTGGTGTGNLVYSASPSLSGTIALGSGSITMTGSLGATGAGKLTKIWSVDAELTNLPTINGGTLKTGLGVTTVGNSFMTLVNPSAITFLRINADNTVSALSAANQRTALGATTVGSNIFTLTNPGAIRIPLINADNTVTATATTGTGNFVRATSPTLVTPDLGTPSAGVMTNATGTASSLTAGAVTGFTPAGGSLILAGADALTITTSGVTSITSPTTGTLATTAQVDLKANIDDPAFTTKITTPAITLDAIPITASGTQVNYLNTVTGVSTLDAKLYYNSATDSLATKSEVRALLGTSTSFSKLQFIVDTTANAPEAGDSSLTHTAFVDKHVEVWIDGLKQYRNPTDLPQIYHDGFRFKKETGELVVKPVFTTNQHVIIEATDSVAWTDLAILTSEDFISTDGHTIGWYIGSDLASITKDESDLGSVWADTLDSGRDLVQATATNQPLWISPGYFKFGHNGVDDFMKVQFTWPQPCFFYMVIKQATWTSGDYLFDGGTAGKTRVYQYNMTPKLTASADTPSDYNSDMPVNTWVILRVLFNGADSKIQVNEEAAVTGNFGADVAGGFTLGSFGDGASGYSDIEVAEVIMRNQVDTDEQQMIIVNKFNNRYSVY